MDHLHHELTMKERREGSKKGEEEWINEGIKEWIKYLKAFKLPQINENTYFSELSLFILIFIIEA